MRSSTLTFQAFSRLRCCTGDSGPSMMTSPASRSATSAPSSSTLPLPNSVPARARGSGTTSAADHVEIERAGEAHRLGQRVPRVAAGRLSSGRDAGPASASGCWVSDLRCLVERDRLRRHHRRDRVLVDELRLAVAAEQHAEVVEPGDDPLQLHPVHQEDRDRHLGLAHVVQERVLQVLFVRQPSFSALSCMRPPTRRPLLFLRLSMGGDSRPFPARARNFRKDISPTVAPQHGRRLPAPVDRVEERDDHQHLHAARRSSRRRRRPGRAPERSS